MLLWACDASWTLQAWAEGMRPCILSERLPPRGLMVLGAQQAPVHTAPLPVWVAPIRAPQGCQGETQ